MGLYADAVEFWDRVGPRTRDVMFMGISALWTLGAWVDRTAGHSELVPWTIGLGVAGTVALWWRRRFPVAVTLLGVLPTVLAAMPAVLLIGVFTVSIRRRDRVLLGLAVVSVLAMGYADAETSDAAMWATAIPPLIVVSLAVATGAYVGVRRDLVASFRERAATAEQERDLRAEQARLAERTRIAQEMHDVLAHKVTLIALHAGGLEVGAVDDPAQVRATAALIRTTSRAAMEDLREVLGVLRSDAPDGADLTPPRGRDDIARIVEESRAAGLRTELVLDLEEPPATIGRAAYRIVQEGLTNAHKHARGAATRVTVVGDEARGVTVEVANRAPLSSTSLLPGSGVGLAGLRERITLLGGTFQSGPSPDGGWRLAAWLPWTAELPATT